MLPSTAYSFLYIEQIQDMKTTLTKINVQIYRDSFHLHPPYRTQEERLLYLSYPDGINYQYTLLIKKNAIRYYTLLKQNTSPFHQY